MTSEALLREAARCGSPRRSPLSPALSPAYGEREDGRWSARGRDLVHRLVRFVRRGIGLKRLQLLDQLRRPLR